MDSCHFKSGSDAKKKKVQKNGPNGRKGESGGGRWANYGDVHNTSSALRPWTRQPAAAAVAIRLPGGNTSCLSMKTTFTFDFLFSSFFYFVSVGANARGRSGD